MADYDLIIVGAGTAGSVLAGRLSEAGALRVLLIEAGGKPASPFVGIPAGFAKLFRTDYDWAFESEPMFGSPRRVFIPRGRMLGGSANINAQIHQWCQPADFDGWAASGARGWSWADVTPVFAAQEHWSGKTADRARGKGGPMHIAPNSHAHPLSKAFVASARSIGIDGPQDYNGGAHEGAWVVQLAHKDGKRFSAYDAYLKPALARRTLRVLTGRQALRLLFENGRCVGVRTGGPGGEQTHRAAKGVVLAAGAYGTPQLLLNSGVGPGEALQRLGIDVVRNAPGVGENLQEHALAGLNFGTRRRDTLKSAESLPNLLRYLLMRSGPLASNAIEAFAFTRAGPNSDPATEPAANLELLFAPLEWREQGLEAPRAHGFTIAAAVLSPRSRGTVRLAGPDPAAAPVIDLRLLSDPQGRDAAVLLAGLKLARKLAGTAPLAADCAGEIAPHPVDHSDEALLDHARATVQTVYHPTSTCRMGDDPEAVVSPDLRVNGVGGLWIADASVMPTVPRGHPNAVVAMIAHRAADMVRAG